MHPRTDLLYDLLIATDKDLENRLVSEIKVAYKMLIDGARGEKPPNWDIFRRNYDEVMKACRDPSNKVDKINTLTFVWLVQAWLNKPYRKRIMERTRETPPEKVGKFFEITSTVLSYHYAWTPDGCVSHSPVKNPLFHVVLVKGVPTPSFIMKNITTLAASIRVFYTQS